MKIVPDVKKRKKRSNDQHTKSTIDWETRMILKECRKKKRLNDYGPILFDLDSVEDERARVIRFLVIAANEIKSSGDSSVSLDELIKEYVKF